MKVCRNDTLLRLVRIQRCMKSDSLYFLGKENKCIKCTLPVRHKRVLIAEKRALKVKKVYYY